MQRRKPKVEFALLYIDWTWEEYDNSSVDELSWTWVDHDNAAATDLISGVYVPVYCPVLSYLNINATTPYNVIQFPAAQ